VLTVLKRQAQMVSVWRARDIGVVMVTERVDKVVEQFVEECYCVNWLRPVESDSIFAQIRLLIGPRRERLKRCARP
jgi:hypothetical protein